MKSALKTPNLPEDDELVAERPARRRVLSLIQNSFFSLFVLVVCVLMVEGGFWIWSYLPTPSDTTKSNRPTYYYVGEGAREFRDFNHQKTKAANTFRVIVVGDSFTYPTKMQFNDAFPKRLELMLNLSASKTDRPRVEVINYGLPGLSAKQAVYWVERALRFDADLVLYAITLNDPEPEMRPLNELTKWYKDEYVFGDYDISQETSSLAKHSKLARFIKERMHNNKTHESYIRYHRDLFFKDRRWVPFTNNIRAMRHAAKKAKVPFAVMVFPMFQYALDENYPFGEVHRKLEAFFRRLEIPALDLLGSFWGMNGATLAITPDDPHPNEIAHRIASEMLYNFLIEKNLVPKTTEIKQRYSRQGNWESLIEGAQTPIADPVQE